MANWRALASLSGSARTGAAVKADGYGLGAEAVVPALRSAGCRDFFVTYASEAEAILGSAPASEIALLHGPLTPAVAVWAKETGVRPVINSVTQARYWLDAGGGVCDLMVDTGINRLGLSMAETGDPAITALDIDVLHSHLASADEASALNAMQLSRWQDARRIVRHRRASLANSAGITLGDAYHGDLTRPGLSLYGGVAVPALESRIRQVARPLAAIMQVRGIAAGEGVGYNATFIAQRDMRIGAVAIGYADGYLRCWSDRGTMLCKGRRLPVIGRVSMDMTIIDLSDAPDVGEGDWAEIEYGLPAASAASGLSQYELLTLLADRFAR